MTATPGPRATTARRSKDQRCDRPVPLPIGRRKPPPRCEEEGRGGELSGPRGAAARESGSIRRRPCHPQPRARLLLSQLSRVARVILLAQAKAQKIAFNSRHNMSIRRMIHGASLRIARGSPRRSSARGALRSPPRRSDRPAPAPVRHSPFRAGAGGKRAHRCSPCLFSTSGRARGGDALRHSRPVL